MCLADWRKLSCFLFTMKWGRKKRKKNLRLIRISIEIALVEGIHMSLMAFDNRHNPLYKNKNVIDVY